MSGPEPYLPALQRLMRLNPVDYQDEGTQRHLRALAAPLDDVAGRAYAVALARLVQYAPEDALLRLGAERRIRRYPDEPLDTYRRRVAGAWEFWRQAGTLPGLVLALRQAGYLATVTEHFRDPDPAHWAEFSVFISPLFAPTGGGTWGAGQTWGSPNYWGYRLEGLPFDGVLELIRDVKPAHARLRRLLYSPGRHIWGGTDRWAQGVKAQPWNSPWGTPPVVFPPPGERETLWGQGRPEIIYEYEGAPAYAEDH